MIGCDVEPAFCTACGFAIETLFSALVIADGAKAPTCSKECHDSVLAAEAKRVACEHCGRPTDPRDRLPTAAGGFAHTACALKLSNAFAAQRAAGGAGLVFVRGGRQ